MSVGDAPLTPPRVTSNLRTGLEWGLSFALFYSAYVLLLALIKGPGVFIRAGTTLLTVVAAYFLGGLVGGAAFGLLLPLGRSLTGAAVLGFIVALPVTAAIGMSLWPPEVWLSKTPVILIASGTLGPLCGASMWFVTQGSDGN